MYTLSYSLLSPNAFQWKQGSHHPLTEKWVLIITAHQFHTLPAHFASQHDQGADVFYQQRYNSLGKAGHIWTNTAVKLNNEKGAIQLKLPNHSEAETCSELYDITFSSYLPVHFSSVNTLQKQSWTDKLRETMYTYSLYSDYWLTTSNISLWILLICQYQMFYFSINNEAISQTINSDSWPLLDIFPTSSVCILMFYILPVTCLFVCWPFKISVFFWTAGGRGSKVNCWKHGYPLDLRQYNMSNSLWHNCGINTKHINLWFFVSLDAFHHMSWYQRTQSLILIGNRLFDFYFLF